MLNSFAPVSSLASTIKSLTESETGKTITNKELLNEDIEDINTATATIKKRSEGLLAFVKDYRTISNVPIPKFEKINIKQFLNDTLILMSPIALEKNINLQLLPIPARAIVFADAKQIEQVLINLINNSFYAQQGRKKPIIKMSCMVEQDHTIIVIQDNGSGIEDKIMNQIFIPFYTTKKNGSGIGLSLSKSILKKHKGNLLVTSEVGLYTSFSLVFNN